MTSVLLADDQALARMGLRKILENEQKLGLRDRIQIVIYVYETGLITPGHAAHNDQPTS